MTDQEFILWASKAVQSFDPQKRDLIQIKEPPKVVIKIDDDYERTAHFKSVCFNKVKGLCVWVLDYIETNYLPIESQFFMVRDGIIFLSTEKGENIQKATITDIKHSYGDNWIEIKPNNDISFIAKAHDFETSEAIINAFVKRQPINICTPNPTQRAGEGAKKC